MKKLCATSLLPLTLTFHSSSFSLGGQETQIRCAAEDSHKTKFGYLTEVSCFGIKDQSGASYYLFLGKLPIISRESLLSRKDRDEDRSRYIYKGGSWASRDDDIPWSPVYLVDLRSDPPKAFVFGVRAAQNEFHWASWGKKRSVVALQYNVKFTYDGSRLIPPSADNELWSGIRPTMFDTPVEKLIPFARELPPPTGVPSEATNAAARSLAAAQARPPAARTR